MTNIQLLQEECKSWSPQELRKGITFYNLAPKENKQALAAAKVLLDELQSRSDK